MRRNEVVTTRRNQTLLCALCILVGALIGALATTLARRETETASKCVPLTPIASTSTLPATPRQFLPLRPQPLPSDALSPRQSVPPPLPAVRGLTDEDKDTAITAVTGAITEKNKNIQTAKRSSHSLESSRILQKSKDPALDAARTDPEQLSIAQVAVEQTNSLEDACALIHELKVEILSSGTNRAADGAGFDLPVGLGLDAELSLPLGP